MHVILLSGWRGVGKDQLGAALCEHYGYRRYAFADALKDYCAKCFDVPRALFDHRTKKDVPIFGKLSPRALCIREAQRLREHDNAFFARGLVARLALEQPDRVVITDWRYPIERQILAANPHVKAILTIRLCWPEKPSENPATPPSQDEINEHALDNISFDLKFPTPLELTSALIKMRTYQPDFFVL